MPILCTLWVSTMPNRIKNVTLTEIIAKNLQRVCKEHDLSSVELASRAGMPQKTVYSMMHGNNVPRLDNVEKLCKALLIAPTALMTDHLPLGVLMSRRLPRLIDAYAKLDMEKRDQLEIFIKNLSEAE